MLWLGHTLEVATWEIAHLGSCHLGKYPLEVASLENAFGKVPDTIKTIRIGPQKVVCSNQSMYLTKLLRV